MSREEAVLIDLFDPGYHICRNNNQDYLKHALNIVRKHYSTNAPFTYLMCFQNSDSINNTTDLFHNTTNQHLEVLKNGFKIVSDSSLAAVLYSIKQDIDALNLCRILVILPQARRIQMDICLNYLFTDVYKFTFESFEMQFDSFKHLYDKQQAVNTVVHADSSKLTLRNIQMHLESLPSLNGKVVILKSTLIPENIFLHGFTTRSGGISYIPTLSSLNLFSSSKRRDPKVVVAENFRRLGKAAGFDPQTYVPVKVDHANEVWIMGKTEPQSYDGIVTNQTGVTIAAPGADCIPILFCDPVSKVCGAAHSAYVFARGRKPVSLQQFLDYNFHQLTEEFGTCSATTTSGGWKGTLLGVAMATVNAMLSEYGCHIEDILVVLGPSVGPCCFSLPYQDAKVFHDIDPLCVRQFELPKPYVDIRRATRILLERGGILPQNIQDDSIADKSQNLTLCTSCHPDKFFSHVRDGVNFGTQIGFISIRE